MLRAIAVATDTSDLVGTVDLSCEDEGLVVTFVRAAAYASAYVPSMPAQGRKAVVPYDAIRELWDDGETLRLSLEAPRIPYKRMVLAHFTRDLSVDHRKLHRRRLKWQLGMAGGAALVVGLLLRASSELSAWLSSAAGAVVTFGAVGAALLGTQSVGRSVMLGGPSSAAERRAFFFELKRRVGADTHVLDESRLGPSPQGASRQSTSLIPEANFNDDAWGRLSELSPTLFAIVASAAVALLAVFAGTRLLAPEVPHGDDPRLANNDANSKQAGMVAEASPSAPLPPVAEPLEHCLCQVPASPAIPQQVPRVTFLPKVERMSRNPQKPSLTVELAAVNNSGSSMREVQGQVLFMTPGLRPGDPPRIRTERGFYYEGPLLSGAAVKWSLAGRGTSYRVTGTTEDMLDDASLASGDAFAKLLSARTRSVRVHGAAMLTRMRDERAIGAIEKLREDARDDELIKLAALARAAAPVYACNVELSPGEGGEAAVSACVMNTSDEEAGPYDAVLTLSTIPAQLGQLPQGGAQSDDAYQGAGPSTLVSATLRQHITVPPKQGVKVTGVADVHAASGREVSPEVLIEPAR